tara:strand:+ start:182 stop:844 length:663 start_codon:yes stop_codon:yes gene_type:complete
MKSVIEMSGFNPCHVQYIWSDKILSQGVVEEFFPNALWRCVQWHFLTINLVKHVGNDQNLVNKVRDLLAKETEGSFLEARVNLQSSAIRSSVVEYLKQELMPSAMYAFSVANRFTLGLHGDALAEQANAMWNSWFERDILEPPKLLTTSLQREANKVAGKKRDLFKAYCRLVTLDSTTTPTEVEVRKHQSDYATDFFMKQLGEAVYYKLDSLEEVLDGIL